MFTMKILTLAALLCAMMASTRAAGEHDVVKRSTSCPCGWTQYYDRCFLFVANPMNWVDAQKNCQTMDANLASVHSAEEYQAIQKLILTATAKSLDTWIGGSNAQKLSNWFWIDGSVFKYTNWDAGQPDNYQGIQRCLRMNFSDNKLWDDMQCDAVFQSVCAKYNNCFKG